MGNYIAGFQAKIGQTCQELGVIAPGYLAELSNPKGDSEEPALAVSFPSL